MSILQIVRTPFYSFPRLISNAEGNHVCIQLHYTRRQRTAGVNSSFMVDYVSVTLRNRFTKTTSLAGKLHRPIHLLIRTPSTREREGFMNLFLYVKKYKLVECTMRTFRRSLHDLRPRCPLQTSLSTLRVPDLQATPRFLTMDLEQFREFKAKNDDIPGAAPTTVRLLLHHCMLECSTRQSFIGSSRDVSNWFVSPLTRDQTMSTSILAMIL